MSKTPWFLVLILAFGCDPEKRVPAVESVTLPAALDTVELRAPVEAELTLLGDPLVLGKDLQDIDSVNYFGSIRGARRLSDGRIVVGDAQAIDVRLFSSTGEFERTLVRAGDGPGEVTYLAGLGIVRGDTIAVWGTSPKKLLLLTPDGQVTAEKAMWDTPGLASAGLVGVFVDGTSLFFRPKLFLTVSGLDGTYRNADPYFRVDREGNVVSEYGTLPSWELVDGPDGGDRVQFGRDPSRAVRADRWLFGPGDRLDLLAFDLSDTVPRILYRGNKEPRRLTREDISVFEDEFRKTYVRGGNSARIETRISELRYPSSMPSHGHLALGPGGELWIQERPVPSDLTATWSVYDSSGNFLGTVDVPSAWRIVQVDQDAFVAVAINDLDVQTVIVQDFRRPSVSDPPRP